MVGRCIDSVYRCRKIVKILRKLENCRTHQPFDLEAGVALKERNRTVQKGDSQPQYCGWLQAKLV